MTPYTIIYNGTIVNDGRSYRGYIVMRAPFIEKVGEGDPDPSLIVDAAEAVDATGCCILPGVIDDQVHFRDPGLTHKGDIDTESKAALAGGVTSFMDMPNTKPPTVTVEAFDAKLRRAAECSHVNYAFFFGATNDNVDTLTGLDFTRCPGVKLFLGSSTGNMLVDRDATLDRIFADVPAIIAVHSEDETLIKEGRRLAEEKYGAQSVPVEMHPVIRSREACVVSTRRAIERAKRYGTRLHVLHLSTAEEADMFETAPLEAKDITAEVCVHHLWFSDEDYGRLGTRIKMNPAIKTRRDRDALRQALRDGRIDIVATDHAPHLPEEKAGDALTAASGAPMVQWSLPVMLELADRGEWSRELVAEKMCHAPARLFGVDRRGYLRPGYYADVVMVRTSTPYTVSDADVVSKCGWTPLDGTTLHNKVERVWINGITPSDEENPAMPLVFDGIRNK